MLTSELSPAKGGIGTYAREIAVAATHRGACLTIVAPNYGKHNPTEDRNLPFEVRRYQGGLHSMRNLPKNRLAGASAIAAMTHAGRSSWKRCAAEKRPGAIRDGQHRPRAACRDIRSFRTGSIQPAYSDLSNA